jgi:flavin reductase (DIM6/NTAB) family NADH-FMN oxidoreductase RutF
LATDIRARQPSFSQREFRNTLGRFATGVTVITAIENGTAHGMTANAFVSVSLDPPLVLVSLSNQSHMCRILPAAGRFGISVLAEDQRHLSDHFAGIQTDAMEIQFKNRNGAALLEGAVAHFAVRIMDIYPAGDHTLFVGKVEYFEHHEDKPLLFYAGKYQQLLTQSQRSAA